MGVPHKRADTRKDDLIQLQHGGEKKKKKKTEVYYYVKWGHSVLFVYVCVCASRACVAETSIINYVLYFIGGGGDRQAIAPNGLTSRVIPSIAGAKLTSAAHPCAFAVAFVTCSMRP